MRASLPLRGAGVPRPRPSLPPAPLRQPQHVSQSALGATQRPLEVGPSTLFALRKPPPGTVPAGVPLMAQDLSITDVFGYAADNPYAEGLAFLGYPILAEMAQRPEYRKISETLAKEMTRKWIRLTAAGDDDKTDKLKHLDKVMKKLRVQEAFRRATEHDGFFGRGQIYLDTGKGDDAEELACPLLMSKSKIGRGGLKALQVIEPFWSYPADYNANSPLKRNFYKPTSWYFQGMKVHASRLLMFIGREVPDILKPTYMFGGLSMSQISKPYVDNFIRTRKNVADMVESYSTMVLSTNMSASLSGGDGRDVTDRAQLFNNTRDNRGLFMLDKEQEELSNVAAPLGTLDHLQAQAQEQLASVSSIPLVKLLGITPSGLNASSDGEVRSFYDWIESYQEHLFAGNLERVLHIIQLSEFGEIDPDISFTFEPLWQMDDSQKATIRKTNADTAASYIADGVLLPEEERARLAAEDGGVYNGLDLSVVVPPPAGEGEGEPGAEGGDPHDPMAPPEAGGPPDDGPEPPPVPGQAKGFGEDEKTAPKRPFGF